MMDIKAYLVRYELLLYSTFVVIKLLEVKKIQLQFDKAF